MLGMFSMGKNNYKAVLFDMDGTLIHTTDEYIEKTFDKTLKRFNLKADKELIRKMWFDDKRNEIVKNELNMEPKKFWDSFTEDIDLEYKKEHTRHYGEEDIKTLEELKNRNIKTALITNAAQNLLDFEIAFIGKHFFDNILRNHHAVTNKAELIKLCLAEFRLESKDVIFVGNSDGDIRSCEEAGVDCAIIDRKEYPAKLKSKYRFDDLKELLSLF